MVENKIIFETENVFRSKLCKSNSNSAWNELAFPVFTLTYTPYSQMADTREKTGA